MTDNEQAADGPSATDSGDADRVWSPHVIKRYANRKLYDSTDRGFVTLREIGGLVRSGVNIIAIDHPTGGDISQDVLVQVVGAMVADDEGSIDATHVLHTLIRAPSEVLVALISEQNRQAEIEKLHRQVETVSSIVESLISEMTIGESGDGEVAEKDSP